MYFKNKTTRSVYYLLLFSFLPTLNVLGQYEFSGFIYEANSELPIENVIIEGTEMTSRSDSNGYFTITADRKWSELTFFHSGFRPYTRDSKAGAAATIYLKPASMYMENIDLSENSLDSILSTPCKPENPWAYSDSTGKIISEMAGYPDGYHCFRRKIAESFYPVIKSKSIEPFAITLTFDVTISGQVDNMSIDQEVAPEIIQSIERAFNSMKLWKPSTHYGKKFKVTFDVVLNYNKSYSPEYKFNINTSSR